jgi:hypothetical protein
MAIVTKTKTTTKNQVLFDKQNFLWMGIGLAVLALGFFLMAGGKSADPTVFDESEVYSPMRITVAPFLIIVGFCIEIYAIMRKPKKNELVTNS